jgi:hypothetical protein
MRIFSMTASGFLEVMVYACDDTGSGKPAFSRTPLEQKPGKQNRGRIVAGIALQHNGLFNEFDERKRYVHPEPICMALSLLSLASILPLPSAFSGNGIKTGTQPEDFDGRTGPAWEAGRIPARMRENHSFSGHSLSERCK